MRLASSIFTIILLKTLVCIGQTNEFSIGIDYSAHNEWEIYLKLNGAIAINLKSNYIESYRAVTNSERKFSLFSGSLISNAGLGFKFNDELKLRIEPYLRLIHKQKIDPVLL